MAAEELKRALEGNSEVELTVTGRKSGRESSRPIWFVEDGDKILLLPVTGFPPVFVAVALLTVSAAFLLARGRVDHAAGA